MMIKPSNFRENIYHLLDKVIETGVPLRIQRKGKVLKVVLDEDVSKLKNLKKRKVMEENPQNYVHLDWSKEWSYKEA